MNNIESLEDIIKFVEGPIFNSSGNIEIIEFLDYHCKDSKKMFNIVKDLLRNRSDVKIILKIIPVGGELSLYATQVGHAILVTEPLKYVEYFETMMVINEYDYSIYEILQMNNIDVEKIRKTLKFHKPKIDDLIRKDMTLAEKHMVIKTPSFIIEGELLEGIFTFEELNKKIPAACR